MQGLQVGARITRIVAVDATAALARLVALDRVERGGVIVNLSAARDRLGDAWAARRPEIFAQFAEAFDAVEDCAPIGDTDILVQGDGERLEARALAAGRAALTVVFDTPDPGLLQLHAVRGLSGDELVCAELDSDVIMAAATGDASRRSVVFTASNGQRLQADFALEPIVSLRQQVTAVLRVEPTVTFQATGEAIPAHRFHRLSDADMAQIDAATLRFGALHVPADAALQPPVILPVSFRTMGGRKGRQLLLSVEDLAPERVRQGAMIEFVDIHRGTPNGRLVEVASLVARVSRGVVARLQPGREALSPVRGARFNGLAMDFAELGLPDRPLAEMLKAMAHAMRGHAPALIAQGLGAPQHLEMAEAAGFTHASVRAAPQAATRRNVA